MEQILSDTDLIPELVDGLITKLTMPVPSTHDMAKRNEIFYPAHMIGLCLVKMVEKGYFAQAESLSIQMIKRILKKVEVLKSEM
jgi:myosin-5